MPLLGNGIRCFLSEREMILGTIDRLNLIARPIQSNFLLMNAFLANVLYFWATTSSGGRLFFLFLQLFLHQIVRGLSGQSCFHS